MGFRTVVMLCNDLAHEWGSDPELGKKIARAMSHAGSPRSERLAEVGGYGRVVECVHGDSQTLAVLDGYTFFNSIAGKGWLPNETQSQVAEKLLKEAARAMGYRLVRAPAK